MQRLALFPLAFLASIALSASLAACSSPRSLPAASPTFPLAASPTPNSTALTAFSASPEPTKTPEPEKPAVSHNLSAENAKTMVVEGGTWVVKNAAGLVTASYENGAWVLHEENITFKVIGWTSKYEFELTREQHPECFDHLSLTDPSINLNIDGVPVRDGFLGEDEVSFTGGTTATYANFVGRYAASFKLANDPGSIACIRINDLLVPVYLDSDTSNFSIETWFLHNQNPNDFAYGGLTFSQIKNTIESLPQGQQVLISIPYNLSENHRGSRFNSVMQELVDILKGKKAFTGQKLEIVPKVPVTWGIPEELIKK